jgi:hypothetical protein
MIRISHFASGAARKPVLERVRRTRAPNTPTTGEGRGARRQSHRHRSPRPVIRDGGATPDCAAQVGTHGLRP